MDLTDHLEALARHLDAHDAARLRAKFAAAPSSAHRRVLLQAEAWVVLALDDEHAKRAAHEALVFVHTRLVVEVCTRRHKALFCAFDIEAARAFAETCSTPVMFSHKHIDTLSGRMVSE